MANQSIVERLARTGTLIAVPIIPMWGVLGLVIGIVAFVSIAVTREVADYWFVVGVIWLTLLFVLAIVSVLANYWIPRAMSRGREVLPGLFVVFYGGGIPALAWIIWILEFENPLWLVILGAVSITLGVGSFVDALVIRPFLAKRGRARG